MEVEEIRKTVFKITNFVVITMYFPAKILGVEFMGFTEALNLNEVLTANFIATSIGDIILFFIWAEIVVLFLSAAIKKIENHQPT